MLSEDHVWHDVLSFDDMDDTVLCFTTVLEGLLDFLMPLHKIRVKQTVSPWATNSDIATAHRHRDKLHWKALSTGSQSDWKLFQAACNKVNGLSRPAKCRYNTELASAHKGHPSKFWSHFQYLSSHGSKSASSTDFSFHAHVCLHCHMF